MDLDDSPSHSLVRALEQDMCRLQKKSAGSSDCGQVRRMRNQLSVEKLQTWKLWRRSDTVGQDRFGDHVLQESGGDEDGASFFERT